MTTAPAAPTDPDAFRGSEGWRARFGEWAERQASLVFILPATLVILAFSLFPLLVSAYLAVSRFRLGPGGFELSYVGFANFRKLLFGSEQFHFLGRLEAFGPGEWTLLACVTGLVGWWLVRAYRQPRISVVGKVGRTITAGLVLALTALTLATTLAGGAFGSLMTTLFYVVVGCSLQFLIGLGLALLCAQPIIGRNVFRILFFIPVMVTPVGIAYAFRMLADMTRGPLAPIWDAFGLGELSWAADPWAARMVVIIGDSWQWVPFIFIVLLAALENQPREQLEAAQLDGASGWEIFRDVSWPAIAPTAATVMLIRIIEAFKIIDLPNVLTNGGPGIATESMTLHSFFAWRTQDLGGSAAIAYMLLFISVVISVSFFHFVVRRARRENA